MADPHDSYTVQPFPLMRRVVVDTVRMAQRNHVVQGLIEADVTLPRRLLRQHKAHTGESISFTAFIIACLGKAIDEDRMVHAYLDWRERLIVFDEVDVTTSIEVDAGGHKFPVSHILRAANRRTVRSLHDEIRRVQSRPHEEFQTGKAQFLSLFLRLPAFVRDWFYGFLLGNPFLIKRYIGTVQVTAVGMFGNGAGWAIITPIHTLAVAVGGIAERPGLVEGLVEPREVLSLTIAVNHDVVDGAPTARFAARFKELIECAHGLDEFDRGGSERAHAVRPADG